MPVNFLTAAERERLGRFPTALNDAEARACFTLSAADRAFVLAQRGDQNRLGCAVLLKYFQYAGRFPGSKPAVPGAIVAHLAKQVDVPAAAWLAYPWQGRTLEYHRAQIRVALGFRACTVATARRRLTIAARPGGDRLAR